MKVYVVMGNDFPDSVFGSKDVAERYVEAIKAKEPPRARYESPRIHWRIYDFDLRDSA